MRAIGFHTRERFILLHGYIGGEKGRRLAGSASAVEVTPSRSSDGARTVSEGQVTVGSGSGTDTGNGDKLPSLGYSVQRCRQVALSETIHIKKTGLRSVIQLSW